jgi:hypothetical protein
MSRSTKGQSAIWFSRSVPRPLQAVAATTGSPPGDWFKVTFEALHLTRPACSRQEIRSSPSGPGR